MIKKKVILIVDDDREVVKLLEEYFVKQNREVVTAYSGREAMAIIQQHKIDLVVSDLEMPETDGTWLVTMLLAKKISLPIIFFSGYGSTQNRKLIENYPYINFIEKPYVEKLDRSLCEFLK